MRKKKCGLSFLHSSYVYVSTYRIGRTRICVIVCSPAFAISKGVRIPLFTKVLALKDVIYKKNERKF